MNHCTLQHSPRTFAGVFSAAQSSLPPSSRSGRQLERQDPSTSLLAFAYRPPSIHSMYDPHAWFNAPIPKDIHDILALPSPPLSTLPECPRVRRGRTLENASAQAGKKQKVMKARLEREEAILRAKLEEYERVREQASLRMFILIADVLLAHSHTGLSSLRNFCASLEEREIASAKPGALPSDPLFGEFPK